MEDYQIIDSLEQIELLITWENSNYSAVEVLESWEWIELKRIELFNTWESNYLLLEKFELFIAWKLRTIYYLKFSNYWLLEKFELFITWEIQNIYSAVENLRRGKLRVNRAQENRTNLPEKFELYV